MGSLRPVAGAPHEVVAALEAWLASPSEPEPLVVETSGSTGRPKRVVLSRRAVLASVAATERRLGGSGRWLLTLPPSYVAGLQVVCRSLVAGHRPVPVEDHPSFAAATSALAAAGDGPTYVSLVPTQLHRMLEEPDDVAALRTYDTVLLGGGPLDAGLRARAAEAGLTVGATYGSSETAGGCVYDGYALDGVALAIGAGGRIRIGGPTLFDGYEGDPGLTASVLVDGWFWTSDAGRLDDDGRLHVLGRLDDVVVSGGGNVPGPAGSGPPRGGPPGGAGGGVRGAPEGGGGRGGGVVGPGAGA